MLTEKLLNNHFNSMHDAKELMTPLLQAFSEGKIEISVTKTLGGYQDNETIYTEDDLREVLAILSDCNGDIAKWIEGKREL